MEPRFDERMVQAIVRDLSGAPRAAWARERILAAGSHDPPLRWQRFGQHDVYVCVTGIAGTVRHRDTQAHNLVGDIFRR